MNLKQSEEHVRFRADVREFLTSWPLTGDEVALPMAEQESLFRARAIERGIYYNGIAKEWGGSGFHPDAVQRSILADELAAVVASVPPPLAEIRGEMIVGTLLDLGTDDQRKRFIPQTLNGEMVWCQGYSEPGAGSDLAALQSTATLDGDEWVLHGHKVWTSGAHESTHMFGLFRSEPEAQKHAGISYLLLPMDQPGIEVRPLRMMDGGHEFNEVYFDGARTHVSNTLGERGQGWQVSRATLKHERQGMGSPTFARDQLNTLVTLLRRLKRNGRPAIEDPRVRLRLSVIDACVRCIEATGLRILTAEANGDLASVHLPMLMQKLYGTDNGQRTMKLANEVLGIDGLSEPGEPAKQWWLDAEGGRYWERQYMMSLGATLGGGASNIQRNLIAERGLGLPRDLRAKPRA
jgi:alkylation response protein AidB-like acyl-CoA dehydrogenase